MEPRAAAGLSVRADGWLRAARGPRSLRPLRDAFTQEATPELSLPTRRLGPGGGRSLLSLPAPRLADTHIRDGKISIRSLPDIVAATVERARSRCHLRGRRSRDAALRPPRPAAEGGVSQGAPRCEAGRRTRSGVGGWAHAEAAAGQRRRQGRERGAQSAERDPRPSPGNGRLCRRRAASARAIRPDRAGSGVVRCGRGRALPLGRGRGERNRRRPAWPGLVAVGSPGVSRRRVAGRDPFRLPAAFAGGRVGHAAAEGGGRLEVGLVSPAPAPACAAGRGYSLASAFLAAWEHRRVIES